MKFLFFTNILFLASPLAGAQDFEEGEANYAASLLAYSDPERVWGKGVEAVIEGAFRQCFKTCLVGNSIMNLRIPFAENHEREVLSGKTWNVQGLGKSNPLELWPVIEEALSSEDFALYQETLSDGREKVVIFDIPNRAWRTSRDAFDIARMKAGSYHGLLHEPYVLHDGKRVSEKDVYNYLYCAAWVGMDCSAFVWHILEQVAARGGVNLGERLRRTLGAPRGKDPSVYAGTSFYSSASRELSQVGDRVKDLRPADIILFRSRKGGVSHSAVIQSVDFKKGVIRYMQSTDEAPSLERGIHESFILFDPARPGVSLKDPSVRWTQQRFSPFEGERVSAFTDDGERFRAWGGGRVVRLNIITQVIKKKWG